MDSPGGRRQEGRGQRAAQGWAGAQMHTSCGVVCCGLSGTWLGLRLEGAERESDAAAAATAQLEEEVGSRRQGDMGPGTGEHVLHREAWHWESPLPSPGPWYSDSLLPLYTRDLWDQGLGTPGGRVSGTGETNKHLPGWGTQGSQE